MNVYECNQNCHLYINYTSGGIQAATSHSSMVKDTITIVATEIRTRYLKRRRWSVSSRMTHVESECGYIGRHAERCCRSQQTGAGRTNGQTFNLRGYDKSGYLFLLTAFANSVTWQKAVALSGSGTRQTYRSCPRAKLQLYGSGGLGGVVDFRTADAADFFPPERQTV